ncbi:MAG: sugar phosphate nucleotidyltransferase [Chloroflexota bacterium]
MKPTLVVLAAGIGSRYGGLKQLDPVGPHGEVIIDYSIYDAIRAGFGKVIFIIRHDIEADFKAIIGKKFEGRIPVEYAYQELDQLPDGFSVPPNRIKPWGTGHAVLAAQDLLHENFAVINADDFYGAGSYQALGSYLSTASDSDKANYAMVGFILRNTLSEFGSVARGICHANEQGYLEDVVELTKIEKDGDGAKNTDEAGNIQPLTGDEVVSMNIWGFTPSAVDHFRRLFVKFLQNHRTEEKSEFFVPSAVNSLIAAGQAQAKVLTSDAAWFGVTYQEDKPHVVASIRGLIEAGVYPENLWG